MTLSMIFPTRFPTGRNLDHSCGAVQDQTAVLVLTADGAACLGSAVGL